MRRSSLWYAVGALGLAYGLGVALEYGAIWDQRHRPRPNVAVELRGGRVVTGTLTREWSHDWVLYPNQGGRLQFDDGAYRAMEFGAAAGMAENDVSLLEGWRVVMPMFGVSAAFALLLLVSARLWPERGGAE